MYFNMHTSRAHRQVDSIALIYRAIAGKAGLYLLTGVAEATQSPSPQEVRPLCFYAKAQEASEHQWILIITACGGSFSLLVPGQAPRELAQTWAMMSIGRPASKTLCLLVGGGCEGGTFPTPCQPH